MKQATAVQILGPRREDDDWPLEQREADATGGKKRIRGRRKDPPDKEADLDPAAIKRLRRKLNLSQAQLAERLGVSRDTVLRWEKEPCKITSGALRLLSLSSRFPHLLEKTAEQRAVESMCDGRFVFVIQCGGYARQFGGCFEPRALVDLGHRGHRPIQNILRDTPRQMQVYLHGTSLWTDLIRDYLRTWGDFGRTVHVLEEAEINLCDENGVELRLPDGKPVRAAAGPATFAESLKKVNQSVEVVCVADSNLLGLAIEDVVAGYEKLLNAPDLDIVAFCRDLSPRQRQEERRRWATTPAGRLAKKRNGASGDYIEDDALREVNPVQQDDLRTRYGYVSPGGDEVYEHPGDIPQEAVESYPVLSGVYVMRFKPFVELSRNPERVEALALKPRDWPLLRSHDSVYQGHGLVRKISMLLRGFERQQHGLRWLPLQQIWPIGGLKDGSDLHLYAELRAQGCFGYRRSRWLRSFLTMADAVALTRENSKRK
ncbi:MAG: helix-turn-helix domain-containing protein [Kiritimatiellae bacterium]|nr:helix-turn-helix domain-containing protein [Kiritimatiellia bacterium]